ncbi:Engulfment and cell motility 2 [Schistosoma japonicum]|nr:Engulfment and cell motility 2 [Schistosoma japonicum]
MLDSKACRIHPNSSSLKLSIPPIITVTSTSDDSESELSRTSSIISLKSSDGINSTHLIDGDKPDGLFDGHQWTYCLINQDLINNNSHSGLVLTTTTNCFPSTHQYTHGEFMHSFIKTDNSEELFACSPTSTSTTLSSSSSSLPSSTNFNNCDLHKLCLDQISTSPIPRSTKLDLQSSLDENYTEITNNHCGFVCICHTYKMHQSKHSSTTSVVNSENKKLSKSISSTITSSSTTSSYSSDSSQLNNDKQTKTFLKRFQKLLIHSIRKSSPLIKNSNTIQVNNNDYNEQLTMKDSIRTKYHPCMNDHKKRSKSLRVISNCLHSVTASQCSLQNNSSKYENKVCNHCLQYNKHVDKSPFLNLVNTKKQHNVHNNSDSNMNSSKYLINTSSKHIRKLLTCHDYSIVCYILERKHIFSK